MWVPRRLPTHEELRARVADARRAAKKMSGPDPTRPAIRLSVVDRTLRPGDEIKGSVVVKGGEAPLLPRYLKRGVTPLTIRTLKVSLEPVKSGRKGRSGGGVQVASSTSAASVTLAKRLTLPPGEQASFDFTLQLPLFTPVTSAHSDGGSGIQPEEVRYTVQAKAEISYGFDLTDRVVVRVRERGL